MSVKKVLIITAAAAVIGGVFVNFAFRWFSNIKYAEDGVYPIEHFTGIDAPATLKDGCVITEGCSLPQINDEHAIWCHCGIVSGVSMEIAEISDAAGEAPASNPGISVSSLRIIDVYGDKCTIVFRCSANGSLYYTSYYPLENLNYNPLLVDAAQDYEHTNLYHTRYIIDI